MENRKKLTTEAEKRISVVVDPDIKAWVESQAMERKWTKSFYCHELIRYAMDNNIDIR